MAFMVIFGLLTALVLLLSSPKTRLVGVILLGAILMLAVLGIGSWHFTDVASHSQMAQIDIPQPPGYDVPPPPGYANKPVHVSAPNVQPNSEVVEEVDNTAAKSTAEWSDNSQTVPASPAMPSPIHFDDGGATGQWAGLSSNPTPSWMFIMIILALLLLGGLVLAIAMLFSRKTRMAGVTMLVAEPFVLILIAGGLLFFAKVAARPSMINMTPLRNATAINTFPTSPNLDQGVSASFPTPPAIPQAPTLNFSQPRQQTVNTSNSAKLIEAYESIFNTYSRAIAQPLKIDKMENLSEKVSTLRISVKDIGEVTVSGSSIVINSIGQAVAKAMSERMKENSSQVEITPANSTKISSTEPAPANPIPVQPVSANAPLKNENPAEKLPAKINPLEIAQSPTTKNVESAALAKADSADIAKVPSEPKRPDWVGKPPFLSRAGSELPDYYRVGNLKSSPRGDEYIRCVSTEPYTTRLECEAKVPDILQEALDQFVERKSWQDGGGRVRLSPEILRQLVVAEYEEPWQSSVGPMTRVHLLLHFDQKANELIKDARNLNIFIQRAAVAGTGFFSLWLLLAVIWGYLKSDLATKGAYRKRLRAAAGCAIIIIVSMSVFVLRSLA
jgi:hypothetical protein